MNINKISFSNSILDKNKPSMAKSFVFPANNATTTPPKDTVEISNKKEAKKYALIATGVTAAVLILANSKKIGKLFSKWFSHNKNIEPSSNIIDKINPKITNQSITKEPSALVQELTKVLDSKDNEATMNALKKLATEIDESEYTADFVEKILKKENREELIQTLLENGHENAKVNTAKALLTAPEQNFPTETMVMLMEEVIKSPKKEIVNLDPVIDLLNREEYPISTGYDVENILTKLGDTNVIEKIKPHYATTDFEKLFSLFKITSEIGTMEQHQEFLLSRFKLEDKHQVCETLRAMECYLSSKHATPEVTQNGTKMVIPFLKYTGNEDETGIETIQKTIEILTKYGDKESINAVKEFSDANKNLPETIALSIKNGFLEIEKRAASTSAC